MKKYLIIALAVINLTAYSQICESSLYPMSNDVKLSAIPKKTVGNIDMLAAAKEDNADNISGKVPRFGYPFEVDFNLNNSGNWTTLDNGDRLWLLSIECPEAKSINLLYDKYWLPEGATLHIYNENKSQTIGAFTSKNNRGTYQKPKGFATGLLAGSSITLEYYEPKKAKNKGIISISTVVHGYKKINFLRPFYKDKKGAFGNSGNCNVNVNCPEGSNWQHEKTGVVLIIVNGSGFCSGSLINSTAQDGKLYLLTAHHCLKGLDAVTNPNASNWMFYWNYESKNCSNNNDFTPPSTSGATLLANNKESDFALFELTESPYDLNPSLKSYFNGWDRRNTSAIKVTGIHHPRGDIKKICVENDQITSTKHGKTRVRSNGTHWRVADWDVGVTEGGSSGSPLFNQQSRIIGQLHGGSAECNGSDDNGRSDWYGKIYFSWNNGLTPQKRLKDWLDPLNTGAVSLDGKYLKDAPVNICNGVPYTYTRLQYSTTLIDDVYPPVLEYKHELSGCDVVVMGTKVINHAKLILKGKQSVSIRKNFEVQSGFYLGN